MSWSTKSLGEIFDSEGGKVQTGPFGSQLHESDYKEYGVPVIMPKDIINDKLDYSSIARISEEDANRLKKHIVIINDIIFPRRGEINKRVLIDNTTSGSFCGTGCIRLRGKGKIIDSKFLFYYLKQMSVVGWIENQAIGATMMNLNTTILRSVPIKYPNLPTQKKIASILSAYDDLIENNNQRIKLLEELAEEIYKEWFVRFRFPEYENTKFFDKDGKQVPHGTKGAIPEGWEKKPLDEFDSFSKSDSKLRKFKGEKRYLATADITDIRISSEGEIIIWDNKPSRAQLKPELYSVFFARMSNTYKVLNFTDSNSELIDELALTSGFLGLKAKNKLCFAYLFSFIKGENFHKYKDVYANGATQVSLTNEGFHMIRLFEPKIDLIEKYGEIVNPFFDEINTLLKKNKTLQETRDLLLPRLISGKLSVEDLEIESIDKAAEPKEN